MVPPDFEQFVTSYRRQFFDGLHRIDLDKIYRAVELIRSCKGMVWLAGNGGSASLASHMATDLQLAGVRAQALTDVAALTTYGNDIGYKESFSYQISHLVRPADVVVLISGSGNSSNILEAAREVFRQKAYSIGLTGFNGGVLGMLNLSCHIHIPISHMGAAQDAHQMILHWIAYYLMELRKTDQ